VLSAVFRAGRFESGLGSFGPEDIVVASAPARPAWAGRSIAALAATLGMEAAAAAAHVLDVEPETTIVLHGMCEEDVQTVLRHPTTMIGSDGIPTLDGNRTRASTAPSRGCWVATRASSACCRSRRRFIA
jgi:N-acyl-D-aspartate/D-glutamate deacylase